jgi:hypothetical protein
MKRLSALATALAVVALTVASLSGQARAAQHQNANLYVDWAFPTADNTGFAQNVDQEILVVRKAASSYWPMLWKWSDDPAHGGYIGLQANGNRSDGSTGDTVDFSLWDSKAAVGPKSTSCASNGEASGYNCASAYTIKEDVWYRLRVWRGPLDPDGQWWTAYIENENTGIDTWVGSIKVAPTHQAITSVQNFSEYFGDQVACNQVPMSIVDFTQPAANLLGNGAYQYYSTYNGYTIGNCTDGGVETVTENGTNAARVTLGG